LSDQPAETPAIRAPKPLWVLLALAAGILLGMASGAAPAGLRSGIAQIAGSVGGLWLAALQMTVIPLIVALLITGVARSAEAARGGRTAGRSVLLIVIFSTASAVIGMILSLLLVQLVPVSTATSAALRSTADPGAATTAAGSVGTFLKALIPENIVSAAANSDVLALVVATLLFALAASQLAPSRRQLLVEFFAAVSDAFLIIIGWVLWLAPIGVFALAYGLGAAAGGTAFAALANYLMVVCAVGLVVSLAAYPLAILGGGVSLARFTRALLPPQGIAISTRSSLACLPAMLASAREIGVRDENADISLPIAVALFRGTGPAMNIAVAVYVAHALGIEMGPGAILAATAVGAVMSYAAISLPGEISYISSIAPIAIALGAPIGPLALLVAVEMIPDIIRTLGNVCLDVTLATVVDRSQRPAISRTRSE
jgi:Na+/H+-dicarboxylate symporter